MLWKESMRRAPYTVPTKAHRETTIRSLYGVASLQAMTTMNRRWDLHGNSSPRGVTQVKRNPNLNTTVIGRRRHSPLSVTARQLPELPENPAMVGEEVPTASGTKQNKTTLTPPSPNT